MVLENQQLGVKNVAFLTPNTPKKQKSTQKALGFAASLCEEPSLLCTFIAFLNFLITLILINLRWHWWRGRSLCRTR